MTPPRPSYSDLDHQEREAHISSRNDVLSKSFVTDLWMKVITRAINDVALYRVMRLMKKKLNEEAIDNEISALSFLFDDEHRIPMGDYLVDIICPTCAATATECISEVVGQRFRCPECKAVTKNVDFTITEEQRIKDISLKELLALWGINNVTEFRNGARRRIEEIVQKKLREARTRKNK